MKKNLIIYLKKLAIKFRWSIIGVICGCFVYCIVLLEIGLHWVLIIPIPLGFIIGNGLDNQREKYY